METTITFTFDTLSEAERFIKYSKSFFQDDGSTNVVIDSQDKPEMAKEFLEHLLGRKARRPVANGQKTIIKALIDLPPNQGLNYDEFVKRVKRKPQAMPGTLGAFSRRIAHTPHYPGDESGSPIETILQTSKGGESFYCLHPWVVEIINDLHEEGQIDWLRDGKSY